MEKMRNQGFSFNPWNGVVDLNVASFGQGASRMYIKFTQDPKTGAPTIGHSPSYLSEAQLESFERGIEHVRIKLMPRAQQNYQAKVDDLSGQIITEEVIRRMREE